MSNGFLNVWGQGVTNGYFIDGIYTDTITEYTSGSGVTIEGVLCKDNNINVPGTISKGGLLFDTSSVPYIFRDLDRLTSDIAIVNGALVITLPFTAWPSDMVNIKVSGYNYTSSTGAWELLLGGYINSTEIWLAYNAFWNGRPPTNRVRFATDPSGYCCIVIGNDDTTWGYPQINIDYLSAGLGPSTLYAGTTIEIVADLTGYTYASTEPKAPIEYTGSGLDTTDVLFNGSGEFTGTGTFGGDLTVGAGSVKFANLTTTQRNAITPAAGMQIFNTDTDHMEEYNGVSWVRLNSNEVTTAAGASYTVLSTDDVVLSTYSATGAVAISIPAALIADPSLIVTIKDAGGLAGTNNITVTPGSGTIDGGATDVIATNYESATYVSDGTNLHKI